MGLVREADSRHISKKPQVTYQAAAKILSLAPDLADPEQCAIASKNVSAMLRVVAREYDAALEFYGPAAADLGFIERRTLTLSSSQIRWLRGRLVNLLNSIPPGAGRHKVTFTVLAVPKVVRAGPSRRLTMEGSADKPRQAD